MQIFIDDTNFFAVSITNDGDDAPFWFQPDYPDGTPFTSHDEAQNWANLAVAAYLDPTQPFAPAGPSLPGEPQPTPPAIATIDLEAAQQAAEQTGLADANAKMIKLGFSQDDINALLNAAKV